MVSGRTSETQRCRGSMGPPCPTDRRVMDCWVQACCSSGALVALVLGKLCFSCLWVPCTPEHPMNGCSLIHFSDGWYSPIAMSLPLLWRLYLTSMDWKRPDLVPSVYSQTHLFHFCQMEGSRSTERVNTCSPEWVSLVNKSKITQTMSIKEANDRVVKHRPCSGASMLRG